MAEQTDTAAWLDSPEVSSVAFHPRRESGSERTGGFRPLEIPVGEGIAIGGRFYAAGKTDPTILFFHGNGEIVADYASLAPVYAKLGANFLPVDYRGYGRSTGQPTLRSMLEDARVVFEFARTWLPSQGYSGPIIVMGRSLGSAAALDIVAAYPDDAAALIIDSGFADAIALLARLGLRPPRVQLANKLVDQERKIALYKGPTLIIHGSSDMIIPVADAESLFRASPSKAKRLVKIRGAGHNDLLAVGMEEYLAALGEMVRSVGQRQEERP